MKKIIILACLLFPSLAFAQYYSQPPPGSQFPGGFHNRTGRLMFGFTVGAGTMASRGDSLDCRDCDYSTLAFEGSAHLGGFLGPRFALMGEGQVNVQTLGSPFSPETTTQTQAALMLAAQFWITPQLWIKGGLGFATLQVDKSYYGDDIIDASSILENGGAIMGAIGYEVLSARYFSIDIQGRLLNGAYKGIDDNVTAANIGLGISWY